MIHPGDNFVDKHRLRPTRDTQNLVLTFYFRHILAIVSLSYCDLEVPKVVMYWEPDIIIARFIDVYTDPNP
jgi:hypothetical protein